MSCTEYLRRLLFVYKCVGCGEILGVDHYKGAFCRRCSMEYSKATTESCPVCFKAVWECSCQPPILSKSGSLGLRKLFFYHKEKAAEPQNKLIYFLKHNRSRRVYAFAAGELAALIREEAQKLEICDMADSMLLCHLPRSRRALAKYGFDQAEELCRQLSRLTGIPHRKLLLRRRGGKEQKTLNAAQRKKNIKGLIYASPNATELARGRYVVLVDDMVTTGAGMSVCIEVLRKAGVRGVICCSMGADYKNKVTI